MNYIHIYTYMHTQFVLHGQPLVMYVAKMVHAVGVSVI